MDICSATYLVLCLKLPGNLADKVPVVGWNALSGTSKGYFTAFIVSEGEGIVYIYILHYHAHKMIAVITLSGDIKPQVYLGVCLSGKFHVLNPLA